MKRSTVTLVVILLVLAGATYFVLRQPGETSSTGQSGERLADYDSSAIDRIDIQSGQSHTTLEKIDGVWMLTAPIRYRADSVAVASILNQGKHIELRNLVSSNPEKQSVFRVDSGGVLVQLGEKGSTRAAFRIGKPTDSFGETFVRREGSNDVYLAAGYLPATFGKATRELRDKAIVHAETPAINSVTFQYGDTTFTLALADTVWRIGSKPVNDAAVRSFLTSLTSLQADDFIDTAVAFTKPTAVLNFAGIQLRFYVEPKGNHYLVQSSASPQVFTCPNWKMTSVLKRQKDFLQGAG